VNSEHIRIDSGGMGTDEVRATVLRFAGNPEIGSSDDPEAVFFGFQRAAASIGPFGFDGFDFAIHLERAGASHLGAKEDASALFDLLAANTGWGLELLYNDGGEEADRTRPLLAP
jgi:hypothetical protein